MFVGSGGGGGVVVAVRKRWRHHQIVRVEFLVAATFERIVGRPAAVRNVRLFVDAGAIVGILYGRLDSFAGCQR